MSSRPYPPLLSILAVASCWALPLLDPSPAPPLPLLCASSAPSLSLHCPPTGIVTTRDHDFVEDRMTLVRWLSLRELEPYPYPYSYP